MNSIKELRAMLADSDNLPKIVRTFEEAVRLKDGMRDQAVIDFKYSLSGKAYKTAQERQEHKDELTSKNRTCTLTANYLRCDRIVVDMFNECKGFYIAGGAARVIATGRGEVNDYDVFFYDDWSARRMKEFLLSEGFTETFVCPKGHLINMEKDKVKIQLITPRYYGTVFDLIESFDFTVCQFAITSASPLLVYSTLLSISDTIDERLRINVLEYPVATLKRVWKYTRYGFAPNYDLFDDIAFAIDELFRRVEQEPGSIIDVRSMSRLYID